MKLHKIAMIMACMVSTPALAWSNGDFNGSVDIGGSVTPEQYSQLWQWKVGTGLNNFNNDAEQMSANFTKLTVRVTEAQPILIGNTKSPVVAYNGAVGISPKISFSDFENNKVDLKQESSSPGGVGFFNLPVKNSDNNDKIGTVKVNATAVGIGLHSENYGSFGLIYAVRSITATSNEHLFYGAVFERSMSNGYSNGDAFASRLNNVNKQELKRVLFTHPSVTAGGTWLSDNASPFSLSKNGAGANAIDGVITASYSLGIDAGQSLEFEFYNPITSTTKWSAPLNIAVTYN
ncbi:TPA: hypothetical protein J2F82_004570 [Escherichia coli]|nr:hypothetical protein [Escherichia coli]HBA6425334.1 hypothetical protein [Escherichia coli]HBA6440334.1 hypothetical protein [Escherichia coli]HBA6749951.1 hypothetical protein [Escherichia coli]